MKLRRHSSNSRKHFVTLRVSTTKLILQCIMLVAALITTGICLIVTFVTRQQNETMRQALARLDSSFETRSLANLDRRVSDFISRQDAREYQYGIIEDNNKDLTRENRKLSDNLSGIMKDMVQLDEQNAQLLAQAQKYKDDWYELANRAELYDKYKYVIVDPRTGRRTDVTYDDIITAVDITSKYGYDENLLFSFIMTESGGTENAHNPSGASGLAQIMPSTGRRVYEKTMGNGSGTFKTDMLFDGNTNIQIAAAELDRLIDNNRNIYSVIDGYAGSHNEGYYRKLMRWLSYSGTTLDEINQEIYG